MDYFLRRAEKLAELEVDILCIKDMAGLLAPYVAYELVKGFKSRFSVPVHLHSHCTAGLAQMSYIMAVEAGVDIVDTALSPLSQGTSQPATEAVVAALKGTPYDTGLDLNLLAEVADYFYAAGFGVAEVLPKEAYKTDSAVCGVGGGEGDPRRASGSAEGIGFASLVERFCICVETRGVHGNCCPGWLDAAPPNANGVGKGRDLVLDGCACLRPLWNSHCAAKFHSFFFTVFLA